MIANVVLDKHRFERLRHILRADKIDMGIANKLVEFVICDKLVDIDKLRLCLTTQVSVFIDFKILYKTSVNKITV